MPDYESTYQVPIVNSSIRHAVECTGESCALIVRNKLSVPGMDHNVIPSFTIREVGINTRSVPKF